MPKVGLSKAVLYTHCHSTEDLNKVEQSLLNVLPPSLRGKVSVYREIIEGFYGNVINRLKVILEGADAVEFLKHLLNSISESDRRVLMETLDMRYNRKSNELTVRLSKQDAYLGTIALHEGDDVIKVVISFSIQRSLNAIQGLLEALSKGGADAL